MWFLSPDIIGVISHVGPFDYASQTSTNKLRKIKIRNLEYVFLAMMPLNFFLKDPFSCNSISIPCFSNEQTQEVVLWVKHGESYDEEAILKKSLEGIVIAIFAGITATSQEITG